MIVIDIYRQSIVNIAEDIVMQRQADIPVNALCLIQTQEIGFVSGFYKLSPGQKSSQCCWVFIGMWPSDVSYYLGRSFGESLSATRLLSA